MKPFEISRRSNRWLDRMHESLHGRNTPVSFGRHPICPAYITRSKAPTCNELGNLDHSEATIWPFTSIGSSPLPCVQTKRQPHIFLIPLFFSNSSDRQRVGPLSDVLDVDASSGPGLELNFLS